jgi:HlyD family secretion protein
VRKGNPVSFTVDAYPDQTFDGEVAQVRLSPLEQNNVVTYTVIITAANPERKLLPGMTAIVDIVTGTRADTLRAPNEALRFTPPPGTKWAESDASQAAGNGQASSRGGGRMMQDMSRLAGDLGLDESQVAGIREDMGAVMDEMRPLLQSGGGADDDGASVRQQMRQRMMEVYRRHLTEDQFSAYQAMRAERQELRPGTLWVQDAEGEIRLVNVRLGLSDDRYTLVSGRGIEEGTVVVTRMRAPRP